MVYRKHKIQVQYVNAPHHCSILFSYNIVWDDVYIKREGHYFVGGMYVWDTRLRFFNSLLFSILSVLYTFNFSGLFNSILRQSLPPFYRGCHRFTVYTSPYALDYCAACCLSLYLPSPDSNFLPCFIFLIGSTGSSHFQ